MSIDFDEGRSKETIRKTRTLLAGIEQNGSGRNIFRL
jgi:hypothetical protein